MEGHRRRGEDPESAIQRAAVGFVLGQGSAQAWDVRPRAIRVLPGYRPAYDGLHALSLEEHPDRRQLRGTELHTREERGHGQGDRGRRLDAGRPATSGALLESPEDAHS